MMVGLIILPDTPRMFIKRGNQEKAAKALGQLRRLAPNDPAIQEELSEIIANHEYEMSLGKGASPAVHKLERAKYIDPMS